MRRFALFLVLGALAAPAHADIINRISSSVQLTVDGAGSVSTRIPSSMAISGNNVTLGTVPGLKTHSAGTALGYTPGAFTITTAGDAFSYSEAYTEGDNVPTVVVPKLPIFGNTTTTSGGVAGTLAGTIATDGALTITAGGAGTTAIGQVIQELTIK